MSIRDLLILNLTLQVFDGLFSYQAFSLGAAEANPLRFRCDLELGCDLRIALQESFSVRSAVADLYAEAAAHVVR